MKSFSLTSRLRLATILPALLTIVLFSYVYVSEAYHSATEQRLKMSQTYLKQLIPLLQFTMTHPHARLVQDLIKTGMINPNIQSINLYHPDGTLFAYHGHPYPFPQFKTHPSIDTTISIKNGVIISPIFDTQDTAPRTLLGWVSIKLDPFPEQLVFYQHILFALILSAICLLFSWGFQIISSKGMLISISRLRRSMRQILRNEFETEIKIHEDGPLKEIEEGCQYLQKQYLNSVHDLNHHIEIATADLQQSLELLEEKNIELSIDKKRAEERNIQQSEFIANMSHEIRTPMNGMLGFTNILLDTNLTSLQRDYVNTIRTSASDLLSIINDILDYSKINAGKLHLESIPIDLRYVIDETMTLSAPTAYKKHLFLFALTDLAVPKIVMGDSLRIKQILSNLIANAVKFTEHGQVVLHTAIERVSDTHYHVLFKITDTGIGIPAEEQPRLFNAFYQADSTISRRFGGSGLGLVICKKLSETMEGQIQVDSKPHEGTTFSVRLQLKKLPAYETEKELAPQQKDETILCIDPHPLSLNALEQTCLFLKYHPICIPDVGAIPDLLAEQKNIKLIIFNIHHQPTLSHASLLEQCALPCLILSNTPLSSLPQTQFVNLLNPAQTQKLNETIESMLAFPSYFHLHETNIAPLRERLKSHALRILIAEDNPINRLLLETLLSPYTKLTIVNDGEAALEQCEHASFDLLILDLQMPKRSGQEVATQLRTQHPVYTDTPILFISANASDINQATLNQLQIKKCLQKPFDEETLLHEILTHIQATQADPINWKACIKNMSGNVDLAKTCLKQFIEELEDNRTTFRELFKQHDFKGLSDAAHTLKGGCAFLAIPALKHLCHELETEALSRPIQALQPLMQKIFNEMDRVCQAYRLLLS
ncbi:MAG: ATP-binding protein [Gammaproteobacteria bacterium]|nr:ATP-binding protein [Gammaproteobacteria bacterium]